MFAVGITAAALAQCSLTAQEGKNDDVDYPAVLMIVARRHHAVLENGPQPHCA